MKPGLMSATDSPALRVVHFPDLYNCKCPDVSRLAAYEISWSRYSSETHAGISLFTGSATAKEVLPRKDATAVHERIERNLEKRIGMR
jgi:hypothetical protein